MCPVLVVVLLLVLGDLSRCLLLLADFSSSLVSLRSFLPMSRSFVVGFVAVGYYTDRY